MPAHCKEIDAFYHSKAWRDLSYLLRLKSGKCQRCGRVADMKQLHAHHKVLLTPSNVNDTSISLNPDKIEILCNSCHDEEHNRFGYAEHHIYIIYGAPCSGKTTYALERMSNNDIIVDLDLIYEMLTGQDGHEHSDGLRFIAFKIRDTLYDIIKTRYGRFNDAYIVAGLPHRGEREALARRLGAELVHIDTSEGECIKRAEGRPSHTTQIIKNYFVNFEE